MADVYLGCLREVSRRLMKAGEGERLRGSLRALVSRRYMLLQDPGSSPARRATRFLQISEERVVVRQPAAHIGQVRLLAFGACGREQSRGLAASRDEEFLVSVRRPDDQFGKAALRVGQGYDLLNHNSQYSLFSEMGQVYLAADLWPLSRSIPALLSPSPLAPVF